MLLGVYPKVQNGIAMVYLYLCVYVFMFSKTIADYSQMS